VDRLLGLWFRRVRGFDHATREEIDTAIEVVYETVYSILILTDVLEFESLRRCHGAILRGSYAEALIDKWKPIIERINNRLRNTPDDGWPGRAAIGNMPL
jgi:hypothetical protein